MKIYINKKEDVRIYEAARKIALTLAEANATYEEVEWILHESKRFLCITSSSELPEYQIP